MIKTTIDVSGAVETLDLILKKIPYATSNALARMARELVDFERVELAKVFQERTSFVSKRVQVTKWPKADSLWARVGINAQVQGGAAFLPLFEEGGTKEPEAGSEIAVPKTGGAVRPDVSSTQLSSLRYKNLQIAATGSGQFKGLRRTFVIAGIGVFQRTSSRQRAARAKKGVGASKGPDPDLQLLYRFEPSAPLRAQMHFVEKARQFVTRRYQEIWREEFVKEMKGRAK